MKKAWPELTVWAARVLTGATFAVSGWSKAVDPWGFVIKTGEYLSAWGQEVPHEVILTGCVALSCVEFATGVALVTGTLRRVSVWVAAAMMAGLLPLTVYIAIASPVSDCGCFGDFLVISNAATLIKNIVLSGLVVFLVFCNGRAKGLFPSGVQWMVCVVSLAFPLYLAACGYYIQPLVDFRPYRTDTSLMSADDAEGAYTYIYSKDGVERQFGLDELPDSTWTFVDVVSRSSQAGGGFEVRDFGGHNVSDSLFASGRSVLMLVAAHPDVDLLRCQYDALRLAVVAREQETSMVALIGGGESNYNFVKEYARMPIPLYMAEDTSLEQLVRGSVALVFLDQDGIIKWKRTIASLPSCAFDGRCRLEALPAVDSGRWHLKAVACCLLALLLVAAAGYVPKLLRGGGRDSKNNV